MVRYIFVDDAVGGEREELQPLIDNLTDSMEYLGDDELQIEPVYPSSFGEQRKWLREEEPDGVILDLWLDKYAPPPGQESQEKQDYRALSLAQELRTRATERNVGEFPIVLFSYDNKLDYSYNRDDTGHDLFDLKCLKGSLEEFGNKSKEVATRLVSLSKGYKKILDARSRKGGEGAQFYRFLGYDTDPGFLDPRILAYFEGRETPIPAHEYARFILTQLLESPDHLKHPLEISGPLIPEDILAARLGVDVEQSDGWNQVLNSLPEEIRYSGPFSEGWERWWASPVEEWWESLPRSSSPLRRVEAEQRVEILKEDLGIDGLTAATPIVEAYSSEFWTVCQGSRTSKPVKDPLDPIDGFTLSRKDKKPWQDELYISEERAIEGDYFDKNYEIDPLEKELLSEMKSERRKNNDE